MKAKSQLTQKRKKTVENWRWKAESQLNDADLWTLSGTTTKKTSAYKGRVVNKGWKLGNWIHNTVFTFCFRFPSALQCPKPIRHRVFAMALSINKLNLSLAISYYCFQNTVSLFFFLFFFQVSVYLPFLIQVRTVWRKWVWIHTH